jgi:hypothetical protein
MNFQTHLQAILDEAHKSRAEDVDRATRASMEAMDYHKHQHYFFNEAEYEDELKRGQQDYAMAAGPNTTGSPVNLMPFDMLRPLVIQIKVGQNWWDPMQLKDQEWIRARTFFDGQFGYSDFYSWHNQKLWFYSIPQSDFTFRMDYVQDVNRPRFSFNGTDWIFEQFEFDSGSNTWVWVPLAASYTNPWLTHAEPMIRYRALFTLYSRYYNDREKSQDFYQSWQDELDDLQARSTMLEHENLRQEVTAL